jgi:hypothetical protein
MGRLFSVTWRCEFVLQRYGRSPVISTATGKCDIVLKTWRTGGDRDSRGGLIVNLNT